MPSRASIPELPIHQVATMRDIIRRSMTLERAASVPDRVLCRRRAAAGDAGGLRRRLLFGAAADRRDRDADGPGRHQPRRALADRRRWAEDGRPWCRGWGSPGSAPRSIWCRVFEIGNIGPAPFLSPTAIVGGVALAASCLPAWRASLLSPMVAIRNQPESVWQAARQKVERAVRHLSADDEQPVVPLGTLISEFADSVRRAASVPEALRMRARDPTGTDRRAVHHAAREGSVRSTEAGPARSRPRGSC